MNPWLSWALTLLVFSCIIALGLIVLALGAAAAVKIFRSAATRQAIPKVVHRRRPAAHSSGGPAAHMDDPKT